jgi:hypothetical protein
MRNLKANELKFVAGGAHLPPTASDQARARSQDGSFVAPRAQEGIGNPTFRP